MDQLPFQVQGRNTEQTVLSPQETLSSGGPALR